MFFYRLCTTASLLFIYGLSGLLLLQSANCKEVNPSKIRVAGENAFAKGNLKDALKLFTQLIEVEPHNERNFYKRFRVYLSERKYSYAISDLTSAIGINPDYEQGFAQRGKLFLMTGECTKAVQDFNQVLRLDNKNTNAQQKLVQAKDCAKKMDEADKAQQRGQFDLAHSLLGEIVDQYAISSQFLLLEKAQLSVALGNSFDAIAESGKALKMDANNIPALMLRGQAYYSLGDMQSIQAAMEHYRQGLHSDPEHKGLKKVYRTVKKLLKRSKSIENAMASQKFEEALEDLESALGIDPQHAVLNKDFHFKKCECHLELHQGEEAKAACRKVIEVEERFAHGHIKLCQALQLTEEFEEAVRECRTGVELDEDNREFHEKLQRAEAALKQSKSKNYYKILGVTRRARVKEIKKAYRKKALEWHPDKHADATDEAQQHARNQFQDIAEAYEILSDEELRGKYDRGEDVSLDGQQKAQQQHGNPFGGAQFFQQGFSQGGRRFHFSF